MIDLKLGDCLDVLKTMDNNSVDSIVTDPPYGISFMNKHWDYDIPTVDIWRECLRVLKPGGHILVACGTRTYHRMACNIEDAGLEIRDIVGYIYGTGFPKSLNVGAAVDKKLGNKREVVGMTKANGIKAITKERVEQGYRKNLTIANKRDERELTKGNTEWEGFGTALKPASEYWCLARKPLSEKTIADNVLKWGTGCLNIDGCRIQTESRFPANILHDGSSEALEVFPNNNTSASRFFYCAKASKKEKDEGLEDFEKRRHSDRIKDDGVGGDNPRNRTNKAKKNVHPTVKPISLMKYLCRLITPPKGIVLDTFMGSGSTGIGAILEGFSFIGIEREEEYYRIADARIKHWLNKQDETFYSLIKEEN